MSTDNPPMRRTIKRFKIGKRRFMLIPAKQSKWTHHTLRASDGGTLNDEEFATYCRNFSHLVHQK